MSVVQVGVGERQYVSGGVFSAPAAKRDAPPDVVESADTPAVTVTLSPEAQQRLEADKVAAEKLQQMVASGSVKSADDTQPEKTEFSWADFVDVDVVEPDPTKVLQPVSAEQQIALAKETKTAFIVGRAERANPEGAAALRSAIASGTVTIRSAASVEGVNYKTTEIAAGDKNGSGAKRMTTFDPSPEVRSQIDSGRALAMWDSKLGDIYLTW